MSIEIEHLTKSYDGQKAVDAISFRVPLNSITGFLGPNGAGKSTTLKIITGYLQADDGKVVVNGIDTQKQPIEAKRQIGYLPESNALYYEMYVREYLYFMSSVHGVENKSERIEEVITMTGLMPESNKKIGQLSKGYKQRTGLAAALIHDPKVLILDEPTSGLDPNQIAEIRQLIKDLGKNKIVLFSSHILQEVENVCDRVVIINKGRIVADDTLENLQTGKCAFVEVEFGAPVGEDVLMKMRKVERVRYKDGKYLLESEEPETVKKQLLTFSLENNLDILSIKSKQGSLEEVFRNLTINN